MEYLLSEFSPLLLGGHHIKDETGWKTELNQFWRFYLQGDPTHPMLQEGAPPRESTIGLYLHGDEGRGKYKQPIMIQALQPVLSFKGPLRKNSSGNHNWIW